jgi:DNA-binding NarL/FixJ family response regulator
MKIVIVEDCQIMLLSLKLRLESLGHEIIGTAHNKETAIETILRTEPEIVLMDVELEESNGLDTIKSLEGKTNTKFIVLTMHKDEKEFFSVVGNNTYAYCNKAIDTKQLNIVINHVAKGEFWLDPIVDEL